MSDALTFDQARQLLREARKPRPTEAEVAAMRRANIEAMPRVRFVCGRDWYSDQFHIGLYWGKNLDASEGDLVYLRRFVLSLRFSLRLLSS